jgi:hypothetical protein
MMEATCEPGNRMDTRTKLIREGRWMRWCHGVRAMGTKQGGASMIDATPSYRAYSAIRLCIKIISEYDR